jgi:hypothetical protein
VERQLRGFVGKRGELDRHDERSEPAEEHMAGALLPRRSRRRPWARSPSWRLPR